MIDTLNNLDDFQPISKEAVDAFALRLFELSEVEIHHRDLWAPYLCALHRIVTGAELPASITIQEGWTLAHARPEQRARAFVEVMKGQ